MGYVYGDRFGIPIESLITLRNINTRGDDFLSRDVHAVLAGGTNVRGYKSRDPIHSDVQTDS